VTEFLRFTLHAPMASWGEIAVGEWRGSWDRPGRSAIVGLLGAALGVLREDIVGQQALADGYGVAVRADASGNPMQDYHTMQTVSKTLLKRRTVNTRADVFFERERETVLSRREYRTDVVCTVVVWSRQDARWTLAELRAALLQPAFSLFAGRRCNPLGLPTYPDIVASESLASAFSSRPPLPVDALPEFWRLRPSHDWGREVAHDACDGFASGLIAPTFRVVRRDVPVNRKGWLFEERVITVGMLPDVAADQ
jgi:CRISPR system Cascade subunit CasD